jgi:hypothetical protein
MTFLLSLTLCLQAWAAPRIIAVGDLHGDPVATQELLGIAGVVDAAGQWIGKDTIVVQTGDSTDKGPSSKGVATFLMELEVQAKKAGGQVIVLVGNHEVMNLRHDTRYVHPNDEAEFGGADARRAAFGVEGTFGRWYRSRDAVARVQDNIFVHGGISARFSDFSATALSTMVREAIDQPRASPVLGPEGPLWYRAYFLADETIACAELEQVLAKQKAKRMIVGHVVQRTGRIGVRCGGRLIGIDTGNSIVYGRHLSVLEIQNDDAAALYSGGSVDLKDPGE